MGGHGRSVRGPGRSVGGQRGVVGDHHEVVEDQWEAIAKSNDSRSEIFRKKRKETRTQSVL